MSYGITLKARYSRQKITADSEAEKESKKFRNFLFLKKHDGSRNNLKTFQKLK
jgi:hypothetical protein